MDISTFNNDTRMCKGKKRKNVLLMDNSVKDNNVLSTIGKWTQIV
jgi:hypothetical protein